MNSKIFSIGFCALISILLIVGIASAAVFPFQASGNSTSVNPGAKATVTFTLNNTENDKNVTTIVMTLPDVSASGTWTAKEGANILTIPSNRQVALTSKILHVSLSPVITLEFTANSNATPLTITSPVTFTGIYEPSSFGSPTITNLLLAITVNPTKTLSATTVTQTSKTQNGTLRLTNTGNTPLSVGLSTSGVFNLTFYDGPSLVYLPLPLSLTPGQVRDLTAVPTSLPTTLPFGVNTVTVTALDSSSNVSASTAFTISEGFCSPAAKGTNISLSSLDIRNSGEDDTIWRPLDNVRVRVDLDNNGATDLRDVVVKMGLIDSSGRDVVRKLEFTTNDEEEYTLGTVKSGDTETVTIEFKVPADFKTENYKLVFKAYSKKTGESNLCADSVSQSIVEDISVETESDSGKFIAFSNIKIDPFEVTCKDTITLSFDTVNIGEDNQDQVKVNVYNKELGIETSTEIKQGLDRGDKQASLFSFVIPAGLTDKTYIIELTSEYDYRNGLYRQSSDNPERVALKVFGCSAGSGVGSASSITASLQSDATPGKEMLVAVTVKNTDTKSATFIVDITGYSEWATLNTISDRVLTLNAGESKTIQLSLTPSKDATGEQKFTLTAKSGDITQTKQVIVDLGGASSGISSFTNLFANNKVAWVVGFVNLVLIVLIILVAVRISRR